MSNIDRAAAIIEPLITTTARMSLHAETFRERARRIARALADAGLLAPDLPRPDRDGKWWPTAASIGSVRVTPAGEVALNSGNFRDMNLYLTPDKARDLANILNAAADHTEQEKE